LPLYEFLLEFPDRTEIRIGELAPQPGSTVRIGERDWLVSDRLSGEGRVEARFVLQPIVADSAAAEPAHRKPAKPLRIPTRRRP
jgi:hypothetical protein